MSEFHPHPPQVRQIASAGTHGIVARRLANARVKRVALIVLALLALGTVGTVIGRVVHFRDLRTTTEANLRTYVNTITVARNQDAETILLPGTLQGFIESPIYARTSGYVLKWERDIGARVAKGELLAELDTPEVDQQLAQAVATRAQVASSLELARTSAERWESLRARDAVSQQELDERRSAYVQAKANLEAAEANVRRLQELEGFKRITAPYAGLVTRRNVDVGDLVDAGSNGGNARALFTMAQTDPLRVYVYVPQSEASRVKVGQTVSINQSEMPGRLFGGTISNTAGAIDTSTRTLQIEVHLPNRDGQLLPGAFVQVELPIGDNRNLVVPSNTLLFRPDGVKVAIVTPQGKIRLQPVKVGRDFGQSIEILSGVTIGDQLTLNPADSLAEGDEVIAQPSTSAKAKL